MNLEQLITEAYSKHQAQLQALEEAKKLEEQKKAQSAIAFIHNPEEFGENLKTAICLLRKLSDELALSCEE